MKNITPGPQIFDPTIDPAQTRLVYGIFLAFVLANLVLIPVGALGISAGSLLIRVPRRVLLPIIVLFCVVGSYSLSGNYFDVWVMLGMGLLGFVLESWGVPLAPIVLGLILGGPLEHKFIQCITKDPSPGAFLQSGISIVLAAGCLLMWLGPALGRVLKSGKS